MQTIICEVLLKMADVLNTGLFLNPAVTNQCIHEWGVNKYSRHISKSWSRIFICFVLGACCTVKTYKKETLGNICDDI